MNLGFKNWTCKSPFIGERAEELKNTDSKELHYKNHKRCIRWQDIELPSKDVSYFFQRTSTKREKFEVKKLTSNLASISIENKPAR